MNIALILSGGTGTRLGADIPKQYITVNGKMIITYCLDMFVNHSKIDGIWVVCKDEWRKFVIEDLTANGVPTNKIKGFSEPGDTRQLSILNGLNDIKKTLSRVISSEEHTVIIHDAARPNLTSEYVDRCLEALDGHDGVMPVLPMKDTVYYSEDGRVVSRLIDRQKIYAGQAPEFFKLNKYYEAVIRLLPDEIYNINGSTEPAILAGLDIAMVTGDENNYKITTINDLEKFKNL